MLRFTQLLAWLAAGSVGLVFITNNTNHHINYLREIPGQKLSRADEEKILTIATTFEDIKNSTEDNYRMFVQYNFLISTQFKHLQNSVNFVVFTNSFTLRRYIQKYYPKVILLKELKSKPFSVLMLKHIFSNIMNNFNTPFYMYTNGDILYDKTLIQTLTHIQKLLDARLLRQKLLIVGRRLNRVLTNYVNSEKDIEILAREAKLFINDAQDYFIVNRETVNWETFPEYLVGRSGYDNALVEFAFRNEIELIDATQTIRALHQSNVRGEFLWKENNQEEHGWNLIFWGPRLKHPSTECARYATNFSDSGEIVLYDKSRGRFIDKTSMYSFQIKFNSDLLFDPSQTALNRIGPTKLEIVILAYNRPEGLRRLLTSLQAGHYGSDRIDLRIHLDISPMNLYDIECLRVIYTHKWSYGSFHIHRYTRHQGRVRQWLQAWIPESNKERGLILEDSMILSEFFYEAIISKQLDTFSGISLEPSFTTNRKNKYKPNKVFSHTTTVLNNFRRSGAFMPNPKCWRQFINWMEKVQNENTKFDKEQLKKTAAFQHHFHGYYTDWYAQDISVWFSFYTEYVRPLSTVYVGSRYGYLASRQYFDSHWDQFYNGEWETEYLLLKKSTFNS